jgi:prepilin-type N-terminal cleavage/methylation domain-containing protein
MMTRPDNEKGYTLIELIIVIGLLAIAIGLSGFGLNVIYTNNVNTYATQLVSEIKLVQTKEMASKNNDYKIVMRYDTLEKQYISETWVRVGAAGTYQVLHSISLPSNMVIKKWDDDLSSITYLTYKEIKYFSPNSMTFIFEAMSGKLESSTNGAGKYQISSTTSTKIKIFTVTAQNGRVVEDD